jgi:HEPN domain-containing protein
MNKTFVKESADELVYMAESDIISTKILFSETYYPIDRKYNIIFFHATQAVEKLLKGYIISNGKKVKPIHNLKYLNKTATEIDNSFSNIREYCASLNDLIPNLKYSSRRIFTKHDMSEIIKSLESVCNFPPIKAMRDKFSKEHNYEIVGEIITKRDI